MPLLTVESPLNMTAVWDARARKHPQPPSSSTSTPTGPPTSTPARSPRSTCPARPSTWPARSARTGSPTGNWEITERDDHGFDDPPVVRLANRQRTANREGASEITPAWMNLTDSGCRTLLGMEVGREFHAAPRRYVLGASEENFKKPDGTPISAWDTYVGKIWGLERDEEGNLPQVGQFAPSDPSVYTKLLDSYRADMAAAMGVPAALPGHHQRRQPGQRRRHPRERGPAGQARRAQAPGLRPGLRRGPADGAHHPQRRHAARPGPPHRVRLDRPGDRRPPARRPTPSRSRSPPAWCRRRSDVVLRRAGYNALERKQLAQDRDDHEAEQKLAEKADQLHQEKLAKASRHRQPRP
jgi:hypothetical protein